MWADFDIMKSHRKKNSKTERKQKGKKEKKEVWKDYM